MAANLQSLPVELLSNICFYLDNYDNGRLRLVCRRLKGIAAPTLFSSIKLSPDDRSISAFRAVLEDKQLRLCVRKVIINSVTNWNFQGNGGRHQAELPEDFIAAFRQVKKFPNLQNVGLEFDSGCTGPGGPIWKQEWPQDVPFRDAFMERLFELLYEAPNVHGLSIKYLQNVNNEILVKSEKFRSVLGRLTNLRLMIVFEDDDAAPEHNLAMPEPHKFMEELPSAWLTPAVNLTHLTIYCTDYFGYCPKLDLRSVHIPALQSLILGAYTFTHDWQVDWIISHASTLRKLILDNCPILVKCQVYGPDSKNYRSAPFNTFSYGRGGRGKHVWTSSLRWHVIFRRFANELPNLGEFRFGSGHWTVDFEHIRHLCFSNPECLPITLRPRYTDAIRYLFFYEGTGPMPYTTGWRDLQARKSTSIAQYMKGVTADEDAKPMMLNYEHESLGGVDDEDYEALCELLRKCGMRSPSRQEALPERECSYEDEVRERPKWAFSG